MNLDPKLLLLVMSILKSVFDLLKEKNAEYKKDMTKKERAEMLKRDTLAIKRAFKEKDEKALNAVFSNHTL